MVQALADDRPPYVYFEKRSMEVRDGKLEATGSPSLIDVNFVCVVSPGSKDVFEAVADEWFKRKAEDVKNNRFRASWLSEFKSAYELWKGDNTRDLSTLNGVPLEHWPGLTPAQFKSLKDIRIFTVEDCANMNEDTIQRIGLGARALKERAHVWLENRKQGIPAEQLASLQSSQERLETENRQLREQIAAQASALEALRRQPAPATGDVGMKL